jgi:protein-glutamine gamma-glutamyltransferase
MKFDTYFKLMSYAVVLCGVLALLASGGVDIVVTALFVIALAAAWRFEGTKWQFSERLGLVLIVLALPLYYLDWQYQLTILPRERAGAATLAHLIMGLSVIKLFQVKGDRDWVFLYLISFFEVLLAAGLSISPTFLATLFLYLLFMICTIIAFEIRKSERSVKIIQPVEEPNGKPKRNLLWRFPVIAAGILATISVLAVPLFFMMPRVGGAGFGGGGGGGVSGFVGFSESVNLGQISKLQQSNQVVMRVRIDETTSAVSDLRWRGAALDFFDNKGWRKSPEIVRIPTNKDQNGYFKFGTVGRAEDLTIQTVYLEPIDTNAVFGAPRIIAAQGGFPLLHSDENGVVTKPQSGERTVYKIYSDTSPIDEKTLRADRKPLPENFSRYRQLPKNLDARIAELAENVIRQSGARNRYDAARAIERHLQTEYGYTLDLRASGDQPVADFLFNIREGHCEYFATSMAVMLRTQGFATRIVNGFQSGDYNDAADAYIVTQKDAHSWVEVYFPDSETWVTFDPTPSAGRNLSDAAAGSFIPVQFTKYLEALQMFWLQYVVAYDNQEQRSLAKTFREQLVQNQERATTIAQVIREQITEWWNNLSGANGSAASWLTIGQSLLFAVAAIIFLGGLWFVGRRISFARILSYFRLSREADSSRRAVEFYERMTAALAKQGLKREPSQTPLEFAATVGAAEAFKITEAYNRVRFGEQNLSQEESSQIEAWLKTLEIAQS